MSNTKGESQAEHEVPMSQTLRALEWDVLLDALSAEARSVVGKARCRALSLDADLETARVSQQETLEMLCVFDRIPTFPSVDLSDVSDPLTRSAKGAVLNTAELREIFRLLWLSREVKRALRGMAALAPRLWDLARSLEELPWVREAIEHCIDEEGRIRHSATPELSTLFEQTRTLRRKIRHHLESLLASNRFEDVLQGRYFAERANRYVLPVKAELQHQVPGIVHDVSSSGATVFIEPRELVELNNAIRTADLQLEREIQRLLQDLSAMVGTHHAAMAANAEILAMCDVIAAKARLSRAMKGSPVSLNDRQCIRLKQARHPLLALTHDHVVANDIAIDEQVRVLVISGPNTGGKTVTLKLLGLIGCMVKVGILPPCEEGSDMAVFPSIHADIGDTQNLAQNLSSFSAHLVRIIHILRESEAADRKGLVLLDELGTSTDPLEGAALAEAIVERLHALGCTVVVTTHFPTLKTLALRRPGVINASHEFDLHRLAPTYRLVEGLPGGSSAMEIAARLGLDSPILQHARTLMTRTDHILESMVHELHKQRQQLQEDLRHARTLRDEAERLSKEARERAERIKVAEKQERMRMRQRLQTELAQAKRVIREAMDLLKHERTRERVQDVRQRLAKLEEDAHTWLGEEDLLPIESAREGDWVALRMLGVSGQLLEPITEKKSVKVRMGNKDIAVHRDQIAGVLPKGTPAGSPQQAISVASRHASPTGESSRVHHHRSSKVLTLDVRGKSTEDALDEAISALDRAMMDGVSSLRVVHGRGTGKLKAALRNYFAISPYVARFRPGDQNEGGDGVTVLDLPR